MLVSKKPSLVTGRVLVALVLFGLVAPGCTATCSSGNSRFVRGYATFWIEFQDVVIDRFGRPQLAYCSNPLTFQGDIDTYCPSYPMVWSYGQYGTMSCVYTDAAGTPWRYNDLYYFSPGYIQEPACQPGYPYSTEVDPTEVNGMSEVERDSEGRVVAPTEVTLAEEQTPLEELRALAQARRSAPAELPAEPAVVRISDTTLGDAPDAGSADAAAGDGGS